MNEGSSEASAEVAIHKLATLFRIEKLDRRFSDYTSEKRAFETDQNERPRRYVKKKITGFTAEMVSNINLDHVGVQLELTCTCLPLGYSHAIPR